jgi:hypothetical protein
VRGIFFDEDAAREVERRLVTEGYEADLTREPFAGEDDDEDHAWAVSSDAPAIVLELLVDQYDGWFDDVSDEAASPFTAPAPLPSAPKRLHRED